MAHFLIWSCMFVGCVVGQQVKVELSQEKTDINDEVIFNCKVKDATSMVIMGKMVNFVEDGQTKQETEQITGNVDIYPKYTDTGRFHLNTVQIGEWIDYRLKISNVTREDSGTYLCSVLNTDIVDSRLLEVYSPPLEMGFTMKTELRADDVVLEEGEEVEMACFARGVVPLPRIQVNVGSRDLTRLFTEKDVQVNQPDCYMNGYEGCLLHFENDYTIIAPTFKLDYTADEKILRCEAHLDESNSQPKVATVKLNIRHQPKFKCRREQVVSLHSNNAEVKCIVKSNPTLQTVMFDFLWEGTTETLQPGGRTDDNEIHVTQTQLNDRETEVILVIRQVNSRHYIDYTLKASNVEGSNSTVISVVEHASSSGVVAESTPVTVIFSLFLLCVCTLIGTSK